MGASYVAHADQPRSRWLPVGLLITGLLVVTVAAAALAPRLGTLGQGANRVSAEHVGYGSGYPLHGGLAGPSGVRVVQHPGYGSGYPLHGGLAGPSQVEPAQ